MPQWSNASPRNRANIDPALTDLTKAWDEFRVKAVSLFTATSDFNWTAPDAYPTTGGDISSWLAHVLDIANDAQMEDGAKNLRPVGTTTFMGM